MKQKMKIPFKFIHVVRNPFDSVATRILRDYISSALTAEERKGFFKNPVSRRVNYSEPLSRFQVFCF
jgi:hypothetical protein